MPPAADDADVCIPLVAEQAHVTKTAVVTDRLRVSTSILERPFVVEDMVEHGSLAVERLAVDREVSEAPAPRQDGDTLTLSVVEERLIVEKRLFVIEEVRITRSAAVEAVTIPTTLRTMRATVEQEAPTPSTGGTIDG